MTAPDATDGPADGDDVSMEFGQYTLPPLTSGNFTVTVTQDVMIHDEVVDSFQAVQGFVVGGARDSLAPSDMDSVFPPPGNQGEFSNVLPHVVFATPTLPWQRSPDARPPAAPLGPGAGSDRAMSVPAPGEPVATWLAVLSFDQNDPPPVPYPLTVGELAATAPTFSPPREPEVGEDDTAPVTVIDVPLALFDGVAPSLADLAWTAHARTVDPSAKAATSTPPVDFSVVIGNRLPTPGNTTTAHLVSLEGFGPYLPAGDGTRSSEIPDGTTAVRLVSLHSWTFTALDLHETFAGMLTEVDLVPAALQLPYDPAKATGTAADSAVANARGLGYVALDHGLRDGSGTVSWYRGPLLPLGGTDSEPVGRAAADRWLRYDPTTGMFDVSRAAAFQLGRLLALHDRAYATALYRWKLGQTQVAVTALEQELIDEQLPPAVTTGAAALALASPARSTRHHRLAAVLTGVVGPALRQVHASHDRTRP